MSTIETQQARYKVIPNATSSQDIPITRIVWTFPVSNFQRSWVSLRNKLDRHCANVLIDRHESRNLIVTLGKLVTKIDKKRQKVTKTAPIFYHSLPYNSVFVNFDKNRQKLDSVASILSMLTKSDETIIYNVIKRTYELNDLTYRMMCFKHGGKRWLYSSCYEYDLFQLTTTAATTATTATTTIANTTTAATTSTAYAAYVAKEINFVKFDPVINFLSFFVKFDRVSQN